MLFICLLASSVVRYFSEGKKTGWPEVPVGETVTTAYTYDPVGNKLSMDRNGVVTNYTYDVANKLLAAGDTSYSYDLNGNLTGKTDSTGTTTYTYDYENRLLSAGGVNFTYDGDGNRISKGNTYYVNDVNLPLTQVLLEQDETGNTLASYTCGLELISMTKGGVTYYYIYDGLGNVIAVTGETGQAVQSYDYDAFGNVISTTGTLENPYQFVGAYGCQDDGVGLIYMRARYYAPSIGRFITRDPWEGNIWDPLTSHRYIYAKNNPTNWADPDGESIAGAAALGLLIGKGAELCAKGVLWKYNYNTFTHCLEQLNRAKERQGESCKLDEAINNLERRCMQIGYDLWGDAATEIMQGIRGTPATSQ